MKETLTRATLAFLEQLPIVRTFDTVQGELMLCHGLWRHDTGVLLPGDSAEAMAQNAPLQALLKKCGSKYVVNGHTHVRMVKTLADRTFVNAGTLLRTDHPCFAVVDFERLVVLYFDVDESGDIIEDGVFSMV
jgi:predicted phosphodiesterase